MLVFPADWGPRELDTPSLDFLSMLISGSTFQTKEMTGVIRQLIQQRRMDDCCPKLSVNMDHFARKLIVVVGLCQQQHHRQQDNPGQCSHNCIHSEALLVHDFRD